MTTAVWPADLPQRMLVQGFSEKLPASVLRTPMDAGPAKVRRRFTAAPIPIEGALALSVEQVAILEGFFRETLKDGALSFEWLHPRTAAVATFRFLEPPALTPQGGTRWRAGMKLEVLPS